MSQDIIIEAEKGLSLSGEKVHLEPAPRRGALLAGPRRNCLGKFQAAEQLATTISISGRHLLCYTKQTLISSNDCNAAEVHRRIPYTLKINSSLGDGIESERGGILMKIQEANSVQQLQGLLRAVRPVLEGGAEAAAATTTATHDRHESADDALEVAGAGAVYERCFLVHQLTLSDVIAKHLASGYDT